MTERERGRGRLSSAATLFVSVRWSEEALLRHHSGRCAVGPSMGATGDISDGVAWHGGGRELGMVNITSHLSPLLIPSSWEKTEGQYVFATAAFAQCMKRLRAIGFGHALLGLCPWVFEPDINFLFSLSHSNLESI